MKETLPDIYLFNPTCEYAVANGRPSWQPNLLLQKMEEDLGTLPLFFAQPHDVVLVKELPPETYTEHLRQLNINVPRFFRIKDISADQSFLNSPKNRLLPWGWSPAAHKLLNPLKPSCSSEFKFSPVAEWKPEYRDIYSKKFGLGILTSVLKFLPEDKILHSRLIPEICTTKNELEKMIDRWDKLMVKAPWSSSGRGLQPITKTPVVPKVWEKLLGIIREQGYVIAEPLLSKVLDMSFQFSIYDGRIHYKGISRFITDARGQYQGNYLNGWPGAIEPHATDFAGSITDILVSVLMEAIGKSLLAKYYEGSFGADTLIFRDEQNRLRINPCLEINVRQTMGLLSLHLEKLLLPGVQGLFKIFFQQGNSFLAFQKEMTTKYPPKYRDKCLISGFFPLTPADQKTLFGAYIIAGI